MACSGTGPFADLLSIFFFLIFSSSKKIPPFVTLPEYLANSMAVSRL